MRALARLSDYCLVALFLLFAFAKATSSGFLLLVGAAELALAIGLLVRPTRDAAVWGCCVLSVCFMMWALLAEHDPECGCLGALRLERIQHLAVVGVALGFSGSSLLLSDGYPRSR